VFSHLRFTALFPLALGACSTALLVDTPYDDVEPDAEAGVALDAGRPRDAGSDAARPRDAGVDAGADPSAQRGCERGLPIEGFATLLTDDCARRSLRMCAGPRELDVALDEIAKRCRVLNGVRVGFSLSSAGCPEQLRYDQASVRGATSQCLQGALEQLRFSCQGGCGLVRVGTSP
jgi:hypothetical protein